MQKEKPNNQSKLFREGKDGYLIIPNYFLREWVKVLGIGPALLYLELLTYCHKEKDIAWPSLATLSNKLGISKNSLLSYRKILLKYGLIKKIVKRRTTQGNYQPNFYKVTPIEGAKNELRQVQNLGEGGANIAPGVVQNLHPNNNNLKHYQDNNNKEAEKDAVVAVNFKKLKEKGEEKMMAIKEQLRDLDFEESFIEKILKDFPAKKIEEKLDLLLIKRNIQNPAGWLLAALKNDYHDPESSLSFPRKRESINSDEEPVEESKDDKCRGTMHRALNESKQIDNKNILSSEEAARRFKLLRHKLMQKNL